MPGESIEHSNSGPGFAVVPDGLATLHLAPIELVSSSFVGQAEARCGDRVCIEVHLTSPGFDGAADVTFHPRAGAAIAAQRESVDGRTSIEATFVCHKPDTTWDDHADVTAHVAICDNGGSVVCEGDVSNSLRIVRPGDQTLRRCIPDGSRRVKKWVWNGTEYKPTDGFWGWPCNFDVEFRDGAMFINSRIKLIAREGLVIGQSTKDSWKGEIERYWNHKFRAHRRACGRGARCMCSVGCCKHTIKIVCNFVDDNEYSRIDVYPGQATGGWGTAGWWYSTHLYEHRSQNVPTSVRAHEFGHNIGLFDEYAGGATPPEVNPNTYASPLSGIMGGGNDPMHWHFDTWLPSFTRAAGDRYVVQPVTP